MIRCRMNFKKHSSEAPWIFLAEWTSPPGRSQNVGKLMENYRKTIEYDDNEDWEDDHIYDFNDAEEVNHDNEVILEREVL